MKKITAYASATSKSEVKSPKLRMFALYENLTRFVMPLCSLVPGRPNPETPVDQSNNIVDISNVGLKQFWNLRSHMQEASTLATAHYPEILDRIFVSPQLCLERSAEMLTWGLRSLVHLHSFPLYGDGLRNGSTLSPPPRYSFSLNTKSYQPSPPLSISKTYQRSTEES